MTPSPFFRRRATFAVFDLVMLKVSYGCSFSPSLSFSFVASTRQRLHVVVGPEHRLLILGQPRRARESLRKATSARNDTTTVVLISREMAHSVFSIRPGGNSPIAIANLASSPLFRRELFRLFFSLSLFLFVFLALILSQPVALIPLACPVCTLTFLKALSATGEMNRTLCEHYTCDLGRRIVAIVVYAHFTSSKRLLQRLCISLEIEYLR